MFNFLFDGKLGEILAPVAGFSNQFHLAIQHHKNGEVQNIINSSPNLNLSQLSENGVGAVHVACRYNNMVVLEMLLNRGVPVDLKDSVGNTPLHYASKYGHFEICKYLISKGVSAGIKNAQLQTAYDVAENHVVRQYLLPLQFQAERGSQDTDGYGNMGNMGSYNMSNNNQYYPSAQQQIDQSLYTQSNTSFVPPPTAYSTPHNISSNVPPQPYSVSQGTQASTTIGNISSPVQTSLNAPIVNVGSQVQTNIARPLFNAAPNPLNPPSTTITVLTSPVPPPPVIGTTNISINPPTVFSGVQAQSTMQSSVPQIHTTSSNDPPVAPPTISSATAPVTSTASSAASSNRFIQPDGFHSSASDPALQAKYGHVKQNINIAPPPTAPLGGTPSSYSMYNAPSTSSGGYYSQPPQNTVHSRYVGYDPVNNTALPYPVYPTNDVSRNTPPVTSASINLTSPNIMQSSITIPTMSGPPQPPGTIPSAGFPPSISSPMSPPIVPPPAFSQNMITSMPPSGISVAPPVYPISIGHGSAPIPPPNVNVFNPTTDCDVVSLDSKSSALM